jgi:hypothetical protein
MATETKSVPALRIKSEVALPDNEQWQFRFDVKSESSDRLYTIAQHKVKKHWGCSCPGWRTRRTCKHLTALNIPGYEKPYEPQIIKY